MRRTYALFFLTIILNLKVHAQWTNISGTGNYYLNSGNVAIGKPTADYKLDVAGLISSSQSGTAGFRLYNGGATSEWLLWQKSQNDHSFNITRLESGNTYDFLNISSNGNIGIGTSAPTAKLDIFGNANNVTNLILSAKNSNAYRWRLNTIDRGGAIDLDITASNNSDQQQAILKLSPTFSGRPSLILQDNWLVAKDGHVSIGTTDSKGYKFAVAGNVVAESVTVKIQSQWPDFVFDDHYKLPSLQNLSKYIRFNGHLPEMPSAEEVKAKGVDLGETNKLLLKKSGRIDFVYLET